MRLSVLYSEEPTTPTTTVVDKNGCDVCDPNCEDYIANNPDCEEGKEISFSYQIFNIYYYPLFSNLVCSLYSKFINPFFRTKHNKKWIHEQESAA